MAEWLRKNSFDSGHDDNLNQNGEGNEKNSDRDSTTSTDEIIRECLKGDIEKDVKLPEIENNSSIGIKQSSPKANQQRPDLEYSQELVRKGTEKTNDEGQIKAFVGEESVKEVNRSDKLMERSQIHDQNQDLASRVSKKRGQTFQKSLQQNRAH